MNANSAAPSKPALEDVLVAALARTIDWLKYAETKNAAMLTLSSVWVLATANLLLKDDPALPDPLYLGTVLAMPFFAVSLLGSLVSFLPQTVLAHVLKLDEDLPFSEQPNLLFFAHVAQLPPSRIYDEMSVRYAPGSSINEPYARDLVVQIHANSRIALRKFKLFDWMATIMISGFAVAVIMTVIKALMG
jgi:hypothetical protein